MHESDKQRENNLFNFPTGWNFLWIVLYICKLDFFLTGQYSPGCLFPFSVPTPIYQKKNVCFCFCCRKRNLDCNVFVHNIFMNDLPARAPLLVRFYLLQPVCTQVLQNGNILCWIYAYAASSFSWKYSANLIKLENFSVHSSTCAWEATKIPY